MILKAGAELNSKDSYARTILHHAASVYKNMELIEFLCKDTKIEIDAIDSFG